MQSEAATVEEYLAEIPADRSAAVRELVELVRKNIQPGFVEAMRWGMVSFEVPLAVSGPTYNKQPLSYVAVASQKNYISVYIMGIYTEPGAAAEFERRWTAAGKKLNMGKSCVRFTSIDKADLDTIAWAVGLSSVDEYLDVVRSNGKI